MARDRPALTIGSTTAAPRRSQNGMSASTHLLWSRTERSDSEAVERTRYSALMSTEPPAT